MIEHATGLSRVFEVLDYQEIRYPQPKALNQCLDGRIVSYSIREIKRLAESTACWLLSQRLPKGSCVAIVPRMGHPHWMILDFACQQLGLVTVPLHPTASPEELTFILNETKARICVCHDDVLFEKLMAVRPGCQELHHVFRLDGNSAHTLPGLTYQPSPEEPLAVKNVRDSVLPVDVFCILYTSGSSGTPKGALLTHQNVTSNIASILPVFPLQAGDRVLSFLPFSHVFERTSCYAYLAFGVSLFFAESRDSINRDFRIVRPVFCTCVPKTLERMYDFLEVQAESRALPIRWLVRWAMSVGQRFTFDSRAKPLFVLTLWLARVLVLSHWKKALGGKIRYAVVGAAALRPEIAKLFSAAGVNVLAGYGMTEAAPFISVNRPEPGLNRLGTVGFPLPGVDLRIADADASGEGEILVRGSNVMAGYFLRPELTAEVLRNGWLHTGDVGKIVHKRFLVITDRKKDLFKTTSGIYISPQQVENHLCSSPFISQALVVGFNRPFVAAVIVPDFARLASWCRDNGVHWTSPTFMVHNIKVVQKIQGEIDQVNASLKSHECIRKFLLTDEEWSPENGLLTPSLKPVRPRLTAAFRTGIDKLFD